MLYTQFCSQESETTMHLILHLSTGSKVLTIVKPFIQVHLGVRTQYAKAGQAQVIQKRSHVFRKILRDKNYVLAGRIERQNWLVLTNSVRLSLAPFEN